MIEPAKVRMPILVVEDSDDDYEALIRAMHKNCDVTARVHRCVTGQDALDYLFCRGACCDLPGPTRPALILLDLNLPGIDGRQVLVEVKSDTALKCVPVIVMTTSDDELDIAECYMLGANTYIQKSVDLSRFNDSVRQLTEYWFDAAKLPSG